MMGVVATSAGGAVTPPGVASFCGFSELEPHKRKPAGRKLKLTAIGPNGAFIVGGQTAKALRALVAAGPRGVTAQEVAEWAYRFSAYCFDLRRKHGLEIETLHEIHPGGWHGRHVLRSVVTLAEGEAKHG
jgi:hypothetical protein